MHSISLYATIKKQLLKLAVESAVNRVKKTAIPEFFPFLVAQRDGRGMSPVPTCWDHSGSCYFL